MFQLQHSNRKLNVFLLANLREEVLADEAIDTCSLGSEWAYFGNLGDLRIEPEAFSGGCSLVLELGGTNRGIRTRPQALTGPGGGNTSITLDPGLGNYDDPWALMPAGMEIPLAAGVTQGDQTVFELVLLPDSNMVARAYRADGTFVASAPMALSNETQQIDLDWWFASADGASDGGLLVSRNGVLEAQVDGVDNFGLLDLPWSWSFGLLVDSFGATGGLLLRNPEVWTSPRQAIFEPIFAAAASSQSLSDWTQVFGDGAISFTTSGPERDPEFSLDMGVARSIGLRDDSPLAERHYRARFALDLSEVTPVDGAWTVLTVPTVERELALFRLQVRYASGQGAYQVRALARSGGSQAVSAWTTVPAGALAFDVSLQWWQQTPAAWGGLRLWLDGEEVAVLNGLANAAWAVDSVSFGALYIPPGYQGALKLDDILTWR